MPNPFEHRELRDWFFQGVNASGMFPRGVATLGSDPFDEGEFDSFLQRLGITVCATSSLRCNFFDVLGIMAYATPSNLNVLVVGQIEWEDDLNDAIEARRGKDLRVYSQEMFLALLQTGLDPLESPNVAMHFGKGHPALEYIQEWGFDWPITRIVPSSSSTAAVVTRNLRDVSLLKLFGYTVGAKGRDTHKRQSVLSKVLAAHLSGRPDTMEFAPEWGEPFSGTRLKKIAEHISMNIYPRSAGRWPEAESHWRADLQWLKVMFYEGKHTFRWPSPDVL